MKYGRWGAIVLIMLVVGAVILAVSGPALFEEKQQPVEKHVEPKDQSSQGITAPDKKPADLLGLSARGVVESAREVKLGSQVKGLVKKVLVEEGDKVQTDQLLVQLDDAKIRARTELAQATLRETQAQLRELEAGYRREEVAEARSTVKRLTAIYDQAKKETERQRSLYAKRAVPLVDLERAEENLRVTLAQLNEAEARLAKLRKGSRKESIDRARANVDKALADLNYHQALLEDYSIRASIDGIVISRPIDENETVEVGTPLLTIIDPDQLRIRVEVEESDVGQVVGGQEVEVTCDAFDDKIFPGKVTKVFPSVSKKSQKTFDPLASFDINTQKIHVSLEDYSGLIHGMTVTVRFLK